MSTHFTRRVATIKTGDEKTGEIANTADSLCEQLPSIGDEWREKDTREFERQLGRIQELAWKIRADYEEFDSEPYENLSAVVADYLRGIADIEDLRQALGDFGAEEVPPR